MSLRPKYARRFVEPGKPARPAVTIFDGEKEAYPHGNLSRFRSPSVQGMNWSSGAFDPACRIFVTDVNNLPMEVHLIPRDRYEPGRADRQAGRIPRSGFTPHGTPMPRAAACFAH